MVINLNGRVALVTGGSEGIGRAIARTFAREGVKVAICSRRQEAIEEAARSIQADTGSEVLPLVADIGRHQDVRNFVRAAADHFGRIDILVNNAHEPPLGLPMELDDEVYEESVRVKPLGYIRCSREVVPYLRRQGGGRIIMVIGGSLRSPGNNVAAGIGNSATLNFAKGLADELAKDNILVNCVAPGLTKTRRWPWHLEYVAQKQGISAEEAERRFVTSIPLGRVGEAQEMANVVLFLASDLASYMTGSLLTVDGGLSRSIL